MLKKINKKKYGISLNKEKKMDKAICMLTLLISTFTSVIVTEINEMNEKSEVSDPFIFGSCFVRL